MHADLSAWAQPTYDGLMSAVLDALRNLDLDYQQDQRVEAAGQGGRLTGVTEVISIPSSAIFFSCQAYLAFCLRRTPLFPPCLMPSLELGAGWRRLAAHLGISASYLYRRVHDKGYIYILLFHRMRSPALLSVRPVQDGDAAADGEVLVGLRPHSVADMRAFLNLSAFLTELLPLLGPQLFSRCEPPRTWALA